jgi:putative membrane-bound dehydrogenase-like protein
MPHARSVLALAAVAAVTLAVSAQQGPPSAPGGVPLPAPRGSLSVSPEAAEAIRAAVKPPAGFSVTAFATPPVANYPTSVAATHDGVIFVCVDRNGSLQADPGMGYVARLVDKDQNGTADEYTIFATMDSPRGAVWDGETLYVMHPPNLTAFRDTNNDGIADESRTLIRGLGFDLTFRGADHTTNGVEMGIDGWLYVAVGDYGAVKAVGTDGQEIQMRGGGNVRVRPDGTELEIYSRGTRNDYDLAIDPYMNMFARGNTNDGGGFDIRLYHFVAGATYGYPSLFRNFTSEVAPPIADYGTGSGTGMLYVADAGLPAPYGDALYSVDWGRGAIFRHPLKPKGATFSVEQEPFLTVPRPNDMAIDGSSRLYVASWAGGQFRYAGENVGYVARLTHEKATPMPVTDLATATDARLVEIVGSSNLVQSRAAQAALLRRGRSAERVALLERRAAAGPLQGRVAAIFTLKQLAGEDSTPALVALAADAAVRSFALRALADRRGEVSSVPRALFVQALADPDPRVQLQAITGLKRLGATEAAAAMVPLTGSSDVVVANVAVNSLAALGAIDAPLAAVAGPSDATAAGALRVLMRIHQPQTVSGLLAALPEAKTPARRAGILEALARLHYRDGVWRGTIGEWWGTRPDTTGPYYDPVAWEESPRIRAALIAALTQTAGAGAQTDVPRLAADLERNRVLPPGGADLLMAMAKDRHPAFPDVARTLVGRLRLEIDASTGAALERVAKERPAYRDAVVKIVVAAGPPTPSAGAILQAAAADSALTPTVRASAFTALAAAQGPDALGRAIDAYATLEGPTLDPALDVVWRQFVSLPTHATNVATFRALAADSNRGRQILGYAVLLQLAADPPPVAAGRGGRGAGGGGGRGAPPAAGAQPARGGAAAAAAPGGAPGGRAAQAGAAGRGGGRGDAAAARAGGAAPARGGGGGRGGRGRGGVDPAVVEAARAEARQIIDAAFSAGPPASLVWAVGRTESVRYRDRVEPLVTTAAADVRDAAKFAASRLASAAPAATGSQPTTAAGAGPTVSDVAYETLLDRVNAATADVALGRTLFARQACSACHTTALSEPAKGPYLGGIFARYSRAEVLESILRPSARVAQGFATAMITTKDNRQLSGFVVQEGADDVVMRDITGTETTLRKNEIASRSVAEGSIMPAGLVDSLSVQELASLLAFLESAK